MPGTFPGTLKKLSNLFRKFSLMNKLVAIICVLCISSAWSQANWNNTSFVHQSGKKILDGANNEILLNGVNLGGWFMWEGWIWGGNFTQEKTMYSDIESIVGTTTADAFREEVYNSFITRDDIERISQECFNVVRIPFNHKILEDDFTPYVYKQSGWDRLDSVLAWCEAFDVYAVLDLHSAPGGQSNSFTADPDFWITLWNGTINQERTARLWKAIADRYKNRGIIAGYDLLNEPNTSNDAEMLDMYQRIIDSIRVVDTNHLLFIEGNSFATDFSMFTAPLDPNMAYEFHFYTWFFSSTIPQNLAVYTNLSNTSNVPIWCGEWGENDDAELELTKDLLANPQYGVSGNAMWTWKKVKKSSMKGDYNTVDTTSNWNKTIQWIGLNSNPTPSYTEMSNGMAEFIVNAAIANCELNSTMHNLLENCTGLEVQEQQIGQDILIFPNPVESVLYFSDLEVPLEAISVFDADGRKVECLYLEGAQELSVAHLSSGVYILEFNCSGDLRRTHFMKN